MTVLAGDRRVQADQWQARQVVIENDVDVPAFVVVAAAADLSLLTHVGVLDTMTRIAGGVRPIVRNATLVTGITRNLGVSEMQRKLRIGVVIECSALPAFRCMTLIAFLAATTLVLVVASMTGYAGLIELLLYRIFDMASVTADFCMPTQ